jgi:hypothetical protein
MEIHPLTTAIKFNAHRGHGRDRIDNGDKFSKITGVKWGRSFLILNT